MYLYCLFIIIISKKKIKYNRKKLYKNAQNVNQVLDCTENQVKNQVRNQVMKKRRKNTKKNIHGRLAKKKIFIFLNSA